MVLSSDCEGMVTSAVMVGGDGILGCTLEVVVVVVISTKTPLVYKKVVAKN